MRWQTEPLRHQVNALHDATLEVAEAIVVASNDHSAGSEREDRG
jgi:hypothetical protein